MRAYIISFCVFCVLMAQAYGAVFQLRCPNWAKKGTVWYPSSPEPCTLCRCYGGHASCFTCDSVVAPPNCRLETHKKRKYPECCPCVVC